MSLLGLGSAATAFRRRRTVLLLLRKIDDFFPRSHASPLPRSYSTAAETPNRLSAGLLRIMEQRMEAIEQRATCLKQIMDQPEIPLLEYSRSNKELQQIGGSIELIKNLRTKQKEIDSLKSMMDEYPNDKELSEMAAEELNEAVNEESWLRHDLLKLLLPKDNADDRDCILEVRAGTGGEEASLFAMDIFKMYERYSQSMGWKFDVISVMVSDSKGYKEASGAISGAGVYGRLKFESGIHRVQRVPATEKSGRVHTSAVTIAILPQASEVDLKLRTEDLKIDTYRSGGSGGQHANTTNSAVRVTHIPSGMTVSIQDERSQHSNKTKALKVLCARLYELERSRLNTSRARLRSEQVGTCSDIQLSTGACH